MKPLHSKVLAVKSVPREQIYAALLAEPGRDWTVSMLAALLPNTSVEAVRTTVHLLLGEYLMQPVPRTRSLTVRLTDAGSATLREITAGWPHEGAARPGGEPS